MLEHAMARANDLATTDEISDMSPLECMLTAMRKLWAAADILAAVHVAEAAANYVHPRLASVNTTVTKRVEVEGLSDAELQAQLLELARKRAAAKTLNGSVIELLPGKPN